MTQVREAPPTRLEELIRGSEWFMSVLSAARDCDPPSWWIGAGVIRDLVWDEMHGGFDPTHVKDVDVAFFDPADLSRGRDVAVEEALCRRLPGVPWEAKNQAAVHTWFERIFGYPVEPLQSVADAVATWPETATSVAVRLDERDRLLITAPFGLDDLLLGICRRNPRRVSVERYRQRLATKRIAERWPKVRVMYD